MTLREKIADWISGGALTFARAQLEASRSNSRMTDDCLIACCACIDAALDEIHRQKAPNATVRRIGRILRGEQ
jgi:hypothetical protein